MVCLLMTRSVAATRQFWNNLPAEVRADLQLVASPLLNIAPVAFEVEIPAYKAVIFSSVNAVVHASKQSVRSEAICVGTRTTATAMQYSWRATCLGQTAEQLIAAALREKGATGPLVHLHGRHTRGDIARRLTDGGVHCDQHVIYDQVLTHLSAEAKNSLRSNKRHIVPLFSPRTAQRFAYECGTAANIFFLAMSDAVAEPLKSLDYMELQISRAPDAASMAELVRNAADRLA